MNKKIALQQVASEIEKCGFCRRNKIGRVVAGEGNPTAKILFVGEAPGKAEAKVGRPFVGRSGRLLRKLIKGIGLSEKEVYITSPVKYLPKRGTPSATEIKHGNTHFLKQFKIINPQIVVLLGSVARKSLLEKFYSVTKHHGKVIERGRKNYFITLHPAAAIRFPKLEKLISKDFKKLQNLIREKLA